MKKDQKSFIVSLLIIIIVIAGVIYLYQNKESQAPATTTGDVTNTQNPVTTTPTTTNAGPVATAPAPTMLSYSNTTYGFSIQYPTGTKVSDVDVSSGRDISFVLPPQATQQRILDVMVLKNGNCSTASGDSQTGVILSNTNFVKFDISKFVSGAHSPATATEYCTYVKGTTYQIIPKIQYIDARVDVNADSVLNKMIASFKFL